MKALLISAAMLGLVDSALADEIAIRPNSFAAVAYSPSTGKHAYAANHNTRAGAEAAALARLSTDDARLVGWISDGFFALALGDDKTKWGTGWRFGGGAGTEATKREALENCNTRTTNARVVLCLSSDGQYVREAQPEPPPPRAGPTMSALELVAIARQAAQGRTVFKFAMTITPGPAPLAVKEPWFWVVLGLRPRGEARVKIAADLRRGIAPVRIPGTGYVITDNPCDRSADLSAKDRWTATFALSDAQLKGPEWTIMGKAYPLTAVPLTFVAMDEKDGLSEEVNYTLDATKTVVVKVPPVPSKGKFAVGERVMVKPPNSSAEVGKLLVELDGIWLVEFTTGGVSTNKLAFEDHITKLNQLNPEPSAIINPEPSANLSPFPDDMKMPKLVPGKAFRTPEFTDSAGLSPFAVGEEVLIFGEFNPGRLVEFSPATGLWTVEMNEFGVSKRIEVSVLRLQRILRPDSAATAKPNTSPVSPAPTMTKPAAKKEPPQPQVPVDLAKLRRAVIKESDPKAGLGPLVFGQGGKVVAAKLAFDEFAFWDASTGARRREKAKWAEQGWSQERGQYGFVPGSDTLFALGYSQLILYPATGAGAPVVAATWDKSRRFLRVAIRPDGAVAAIASMQMVMGKSKTYRDLAVEFVDLQNRRRLGDTLSGDFFQCDTIDEIVYSPDGRKLAVGGRSHSLKGHFMVDLWDVESRRRDRRLHIAAEPVLAFSPDGGTLAIGSLLFDLRTGGIGKEIKSPVPVAAIAYDPKGRWIATGSGADRQLTLWNAVTGEKLASLRALDAAVTDVAVSSDGALIATSGQSDESWEDTEAAIWDVEAILKAAPKDDYIAKLAATPMAQQAFTLAIEWSAEGLEHASGLGAGALLTEPGKESAALAAKLGVPLAKFPTRDGSLRGIDRQATALAAEIKSKHGAVPERLFTLGYRLTAVSELYSPNPAKNKGPSINGFQRTVERCCRDVGLPEGVYRRLSARVAAHEPAARIQLEARRLTEEIFACLNRRPSK